MWHEEGNHMLVDKQSNAQILKCPICESTHVIDSRECNGCEPKQLTDMLRCPVCGDKTNPVWVCQDCDKVFSF